MKHLLLIAAAFVTFTVTACSFLQEDTSGLVELVEKAVANKAEWQGKEVTVYGYVSQYRPSPEGTDKYLHLTPSPAAVSSRPHGLERHVSCTLANGNTLEPMTAKYVTVKGTIAKITSTNYLDQKRIDLEPCELVK
jgi:hypothetical protein